MKLPKKPERYPNGSVRRLDEVADSVDQIIDYLSDKEASKGECGLCGAEQKGIFPCHNSTCPKLDPPQQEESRGECNCPCHDPSVYRPHKEGHGCCDKAVRPPSFMHKFEPDKNGKCWCNIPKESGYHTQPQLKEESPKEDEVIGRNWCFEGDELVITRGKWVIDRYKKHVRKD